LIGQRRSRPRVEQVDRYLARIELGELQAGVAALALVQAALGDWTAGGVPG